MVNKLYAIMPVYNENPERIYETIKRTLPFVDKVIVIIDGSEKEYPQTDFDKKRTIIITHPANLGKGGALRTGMKYARLTGARHLLLIDSDGQHSPQDIPKLLKKYNENNVVLGYRIFNKNMPLTLRFGNWVINKTLRILFGIKVKDSQCGFKILPTRFLERMMWSSQEYAVETEMLINMKKQGIPYEEVNIQTIYEDSYKGTYVFDGIKIVLSMIFWRLTK